MLVDRTLAAAVGASAAVVAAVCWGIAAALAGRRRRCVHQVILAGAPAPSLVVRSEMRRLTRPARCASAAAALEAALHEGVHWYTYLPASRPPPGVLHLPPNAPVIHEITTCLLNGQVSPRAMILLDRFIQGGYGAAVYQGGPEWAKRELGRIRFELLQAARALAEDAV
jgi:hypothetical protein